MLSMNKANKGVRIGYGGADPHNSLPSTSFESSAHFPHKTEKLLHMSGKTAVYYPRKEK